MLLAPCPHCKTGRVFMDGHRNECTCLQCGWTPTRAITADDEKSRLTWHGASRNPAGRKPKGKGIGALAR